MKQLVKVLLFYMPIVKSIWVSLKLNDLEFVKMMRISFILEKEYILTVVIGLTLKSEHL